MVRVAISSAAFEAIAATLPLGSVGFEHEPNAPARSKNLGNLILWQKTLNSVGWFIPPYVQMGALNKIVGDIQARGSQYGQDELEQAIMMFYGPGGLPAMVKHRYPIAPVIKDYSETIAVVGVDRGRPALVDAALFGRRDALYLSLTAQIRLELREDSQHVEERLAGGRGRVDRLFGRLQRRALRRTMS